MSPNKATTNSAVARLGYVHTVHTGRLFKNLPASVLQSVFKPCFQKSPRHVNLSVRKKKALCQAHFWQITNDKQVAIEIRRFHNNKKKMEKVPVDGITVTYKEAVWAKIGQILGCSGTCIFYYL